MEAVFERIAKEWGTLDSLVHSIAFSPKEALQGRVVDVTREGFATTMDVSCWSFIRMAKLAEPLMRKGGTLFTMSYFGSQMVIENYNVMGVAKAALEAAVRYVAAELGPKGIRVNAISPGPLATRAASGIPAFDALLDKARAKAPARSLVSIDDVGAERAERLGAAPGDRIVVCDPDHQAFLSVQQLGLHRRNHADAFRTVRLHGFHLVRLIFRLPESGCPALCIELG